ncbi:Pkinase-domain-containing protein [Pisolithus orientalis]|uniref:Pkinase-domain-containing protein n=1 Tax=Pisolithus orientalis TaxID=936130 RepID=UPI0022244D81|nr:Pkinase-domain-containing protein [Pisolithus orientalis]KAI6004391.1 Pkinase-domain-containing protein [Pisolithus orientalis]
MSVHGHKHTFSVTQNHKAQLANAYNELGKELSSQRIRIIGNYTLGKVIGEGAYGKVRIGTHRLTSNRVAIKQIPKAMSASLTREIHHHRQLHHPHVTQMYEVIATESYIWIVTELCCGGELFDYLAEKGRLSEDEARIIFGQLCLAVAYLHDKGIVHRDLKLENVLLDERCRVKLGDFGFTREYERGVYMETFCEMLKGTRYLGPEVDVWSMGVILYCLLTGTLPFDDDDEAVMKEKVIRGKSTDARDLIGNILQMDPSKRLTIPQILSSPWFTTKDETASKEEPVTPSVSDTPSLTVRPTTISECQDIGLPSASSATSMVSDATFVSATSNISQPLTSDSALEDPFLSNDGPSVQIHPNPSQSTLTKGDRVTRNGSAWQPGTTIEEEDSAPSMRTKRRSVSSGLSENGAQFDSPIPLYPPQDFASLLNTPTPIIFSTPAERELLNALSALDACDAAGAIWWMLMRKHEKRIVDEVRASSTEGPAPQSEHHPSSRRRVKRDVSVQTDESGRLAPEFAVVPPTPTANAIPRPCTPPRAKSPFLSPSPTTAESSGRGSTRGTEGKDKDPLKQKRDGKVRSGSISIMQRATTALGAAGLVRKKSADGVREEREKTKDHEKKISGDDPRSSHGSSGSAKLTKSPPVRAREGPAVPTSQTLESSAIPGSPWVVAGGRTSPMQGQTPTPAASPGDTLTSLPNFNEDGSRIGAHRSRASILSTLRLWFNEDRKGKRKEPAQLPQSTSRELNYSRTVVGPPPASVAKTPKVPVKRRTSDSGRGRRVKRASVSSRRSSSVNSRRSSVNSTQVFVLDQSHLEQIPSVRSFGGDTPNSERGDPSSRPSSIQSFSHKGKHRKSPSTGSNGSTYFRASSPLPKYHHRRHGSSSSTRVVRQVPTTPVSTSRPQHNRTNSAASSAHSLTSSRPASFYEVSEGEGTPFRGYPSRKSDDSTPRRGAGTFIAQKRLTPFTSPHGSGTIGRTSWKKSWGNEPPGWQSRSTHLPVEVLVISPAPDIRDVFSAGGRPSLSLGDESDWVDEDEDVPEFAGVPSSAKTNPTPLVLSSPRSHHSRGRTTKTRTGGVGRGGRAKGGQSPVGRVSPAPPSELTYEAPETRGGRWQLPGVRGPAFRHAIQEEDEEEEE